MLDPARFALTEQKNNDWTVTVEANTEVSAVMNPAFFANIAQHLRPYDTIRVRIDTGEWYLELMVVQCDRAWAKCVKRAYINFVEEAEEVAAGEELITGSPLDQFKVQYRGPHLKFCVIRTVDNEPVKEQCDTKKDAELWLDNHLKAKLM